MSRPRIRRQARNMLAARYDELTAAAEPPAARLATASDPVLRASILSELASIEQETARLHDALFDAEPGEDGIGLADALRSSATLLRLVAMAEAATGLAVDVLVVDEAVLFFHKADPYLVRTAEPFIAALAMAEPGAARAAVFDELYAAVLPEIGATAAETLAWLARIEADRTITAAQPA